MSSLKVLRYKNTDIPRQPGEVARLRVVKGADMGVVFLCKVSSVILGRGEEVDVLVNDLKASRNHARLDYTANGWEMTDLGSANGIFFQGEFVRSFALKSGEHFTVGETIFEFFDGNESAKVLMSPLRSGNELAQMDQALASQRLRVQSFSQMAQAAPTLSNKKPPILLILAMLGGVFFYFDDIKEMISPAPKKAPVKKEAKPAEPLSAFLPNTVGNDVQKTAEQYYRQGFREFREGNYLRAKAQFELSLQVNPSHQLARHYLLGSEKEIENQIKETIDSAQKASAAGRLHEAKGYYETAMRLMYNDRSNPDFIECEDAVNKIKTDLNRMPAGSGEVK